MSYCIYCDSLCRTSVNHKHLRLCLQILAHDHMELQTSANNFSTHLKFTFNSWHLVLRCERVAGILTGAAAAATTLSSPAAAAFLLGAAATCLSLQVSSTSTSSSNCRESIAFHKLLGTDSASGSLGYPQRRPAVGHSRSIFACKSTSRHYAYCLHLSVDLLFGIDPSPTAHPFIRLRRST